jgi:putative tricarboxylic transport membrane protein
MNADGWRLASGVWRLDPVSWRPDREIEIVAGTPPGGGLDRAARALAEAMRSIAPELPARVVNIPGDGARKCWETIERRAGDPHVVAISSSNLATDHILGLGRHHHERDFTPLAILYTEYIAFLARAGSPLASGKALLERLGADAGTVTVALSTSLGNPNHIALAKVVRHAGGDVRAPRIRVFDSALDAVADVLAGEADICAVTAASAAKELEAGTMRALAVSSPRRLDGRYAQSPAWVELSVDCVIGAWRGITGARGLTAEQVAFWESLLAAAVGTPAWREELQRLYWTPSYLQGAKLREELASERAEMTAILAELGLAKA